MQTISCIAELYYYTATNRIMPRAKATLRQYINLLKITHDDNVKFTS